ncbi:MAG: hypothetical protein JNM66_16085 [Bryobacterales bacterium]|nr:hypothetical protein [Bryobacterales bacterium]
MLAQQFRMQAIKAKRKGVHVMINLEVKYFPAKSHTNGKHSRQSLPSAVRAAAAAVACLLIHSIPSPAQVNLNYGIRTVAGATPQGDGGLATNAIISSPTDLVADTTGSLFILQGLRIRRILPNGVISTFAGNGTPIVSGDGGSATEAGLGYVFGMSLGRGNTILYSELLECRLRRIDLATARISLVAGNGQCVNSTDGASAAVSSLGRFVLAKEDARGRIWFTESQSARVRRIDTDGRISTVAGNGTQNYSGDDGPASASTVAIPSHVAVDPSGNAYFFDEGFCRIRKIGVDDNRISLVAGTFCGFSGDGGVATAARLEPNPSALYIDPGGEFLYVVSGNRIRRVDLKTRLINTIAGNGQMGSAPDSVNAVQSPLNYAWGIAQTRSGQLAFAEVYSGRIRQIDTAGQVRTVAGRPVSAADGATAMEAIHGVASTVIPGENGTFIFSDGFRIRAVDTNGGVATLAGSAASSEFPADGANAKLVPLRQIRSLARDRLGNLYFMEGSGRIRKIAPSGLLSTVNRTALGSSPLSPVVLSPKQDALYVAESPGNRIVRIDLLTGALSTVAGRGEPNGNGTSGFSGDGSLATQALLSFPTDLAFDKDGNLYFQDFGNARIRRVATNGTISTVAGSGQRGIGAEGVAAYSSPLAPAASSVGHWPLVVDDESNVYFAENYRIRRIDGRSGTIRTIAGGLEPGSSGDNGPALQAKLSASSAIAIGTGGQIYVSDAWNGRIRLLTPMAVAAPAITAVVQPGNFGGRPVAAPGGYVEIYGTRLSESTRAWAGADFVGANSPTKIDNVGVEVGGRPAFVQLVSPNQINAIIPAGIPTGNVAVRVVGPGGASEPFSVALRPRAPALLSPPAFSRNGLQYVAAYLPDGSFAGPQDLIAGVSFRPARAEERIVMYGIGFGDVVPVVPPGTIATVPSSLPNCELTIGDVRAVVEYAGLAVGFVGLYQLNAVIPTGISGDLKIGLSVDGILSDQSLFITVN